MIEEMITAIEKGVELDCTRPDGRTSVSFLFHGGRLWMATFITEPGTVSMEELSWEDLPELLQKEVEAKSSILCL